MSSDVDEHLGGAPTMNGNSSQGRAGTRTLTREAVERANRDTALATGLAAAEQELKQSSQDSSATESEERDSVELGLRVEKELGRKSGVIDTPSSSLVGQNPEGAASSSTVSQENNSIAVTDLLERLGFANNARVKAEDELNYLRTAMAEMSQMHQGQLGDLGLKQKKLQKDKSDLEEQLLHLRATSNLHTEDLREQLLSVQQANARLRDESDLEEERIKHLISHERSARLLGERQEEAQPQQRIIEMVNDELRLLHSMNDGEDDNSDVGVDAPQVPDTPVDSTTRRPRRNMKQLEAALLSQRCEQRKMTDELTELRLQMSGMEQGHQAQIGDLQFLLDQERQWQANQKQHDTSVASPTCGASGLQKLQLPRRRASAGVRGRGGKKDTLAIIDEEDDVESNDGSFAASANVSSNGSSHNDDQDIGDVRDFDEDGEVCEQASRRADRATIARQDLQVQDLREQVWELKEALAGAQAELDQQGRHTAQVAEEEKDKENDVNLVKQELATLKQTLAGQKTKHTHQVDALKKLLAATESDVAGKDESYQAQLEDAQRRETKLLKDTEDAKQDLFRALEAKRIGFLRLEDMKREVESTRSRYEIITRDLKNQLSKYEIAGPTASTSKSSTSEVQSVREQLQSAVEDRNVLAHTLEWKEVQWKSKHEHLELENKQMAADLKHKHSADISKLQRKLDEQQAELKQRMEQWEQEKKELEERVAARPVPSAAATASGWLALLRCPTRMLDPANMSSQFSSSSTWGSSSSGGAPEAVYAQEVCWQVLNSVQGIIALLCDSPGLKILQATARANMIWDSQALLGAMVVSLLAVPASAAWLRRAILTHQTLAKMEGAAGDVPGFAIHTLGRLEFREGSHGSFESSVTVVHLPAEPRLGREATVVVIVEPLVTAKSAARQGDCRSEARSAHQSVVSDDVQPSDSASNIATNVRYF